MGAELAEATLAGVLGELRAGGLSCDRTANVKAIIGNMSFSKELKQMQTAKATTTGTAVGEGAVESVGNEVARAEAEALARVPRELAVVQVQLLI